jgi:hypothetical protein
MSLQRFGLSPNAKTHKIPVDAAAHGPQSAPTSHCSIQRFFSDAKTGFEFPIRKCELPAKRLLPGRRTKPERDSPSSVPIFSDDVEVPVDEPAWKHLDAFSKPFRISVSDLAPVTGGIKTLQHASIAERIGNSKPLFGSDKRHYVK